ncbi:hypothetical protein PHYSODRAFT_295152 [Phytophthora sojae]|uniref:Uncharacterized protein n=1 Tax=Phytophthora sojae (strain P6497) TaxID=1094619 RepID=G4YLE3_PHYSP|nr:hypothetical protein PHYSODRAFT_295152 [Phytophthora sojae]EGZ30317.1 hypothetical protein PHYSODRAFT_295152 [Phytophthora sojae]|eukprot:XP_009517592.1 hypothetical protein PHYSODRAFT_295152 [Phytophthora sojae]
MQQLDLMLEAMQSPRRTASHTASQVSSSWPASSTRAATPAEWALRVTPPLLPHFPVLAGPAATPRLLPSRTLEEALWQLQLLSPRHDTVPAGGAFLQASWQDGASDDFNYPMPPLLALSARMTQARFESSHEEHFGDPAFSQLEAGEQFWRMPCLMERLFQTPVEAQRALNAFARPHGYAIVYQGTSYDKRRQKRLIRYG